MAGFLGAKEVLTRERIKEILLNKEYSYIKENVSLLGIEGDDLILKFFSCSSTARRRSRSKRSPGSSFP